MLIVVVVGSCMTQVVRLAKVTIFVTDENGNPVEGADIGMGLHGGTLRKDGVKGKTDKEGNFVVSGASLDGVIIGEVEKPGYYLSVFQHAFVIAKLGVWQPWNKLIKIELRPKIKPVPMFARKRRVKIPAVGKKIGFDLTKFDWVAPYGLGTAADFIIKVESRYNSFDDRVATLDLSFSNEFDGIQSFELDMGGNFGVGSDFRTPRYAPENGYSNHLATHFNPKAPGHYAYKTKDTYYFFRVRSEQNKNNELNRAMYGKLKGDLIAKPTKDGLAEIEFYYWLNPDYTRNMEFDPESNLFSSLPSFEDVSEP